MKISPKASPLKAFPLKDCDTFSHFREGTGQSLRWLVPFLLAASPLVQAQMLHTEPSDGSREGWDAPSRTELVTRMSFDEQKDLLAFQLHQADGGEIPGKVWAPFYRWSLGPGLKAGSKGSRNAVTAQDAREIPEPSLGAVLAGGLALLVSFNLLRRRRLV